MKKKLAIFTLVLVLLLVLTTSVFATVTHVDCSNIPYTICYGIELEKGDYQDSTISMYLLEGITINTYVWTENNSLFQMGSELMYSSNGTTWAVIPNTLKIAAGGGGNMGGSWVVNQDGYFKLRVTSGDASQARSSGGGTMSIETN